MNLSSKKAFTLIEMVVAITIFTIFIGIISGTYLYIARAQHDTGEVRKVYSGARDVMEMIVAEARTSAPYYDCYDFGGGGEIPECTGTYNLELSAVDVLILLGRSEDEITVFSSDEGEVFMKKYELGAGDVWVPQIGYELGALPISGDEAVFEGLYFEIYPAISPEVNYGDVSVQYQPHVTVYMRVAGETRNTSEMIYDLQTTISSRVYE
ncbi:MAG: prepilin-type N-terminal cleavage/methylation domain-containing protein [Patescibacteria group bacterium]|nr:prepilin-type N-terminal cleavage/methylation domain-containing protein [Patescibacteria group bacterium]